MFAERNGFSLKTNKCLNSVNWEVLSSLLGEKIKLTQEKTPVDLSVEFKVFNQ